MLTEKLISENVYLPSGILIFIFDEFFLVVWMIIPMDLLNIKLVSGFEIWLIPNNLHLETSFILNIIQNK